MPSFIHTGVYLTLNGVSQPNNSAILIDDLRVGSIQCVTDRTPCCVSPVRTGEWYFPGDGGIVPSISSPTSMTSTLYRNRGDDGTVNLYHRPISHSRNITDVMGPTGRYCCVVPDATGIVQWACAIIGEFVHSEKD